MSAPNLFDHSESTWQAEGHEIRHPEMIAVNRTYALIFTYLSDDPEEAKQREHEVSLLLMESVEPLDVASTQDGKQ
jgi:hypothetical protein